MTTFDPDASLDGVLYAEYNPRRIGEEEFEGLKESILAHGMVKPIILNSDGTLVAGHQRTRALRALGFESAPAIRLGRYLERPEEVTFNLLHNSVETDGCEVTIYPVDGLRPGEFSTVPWQSISVGSPARGAIAKEVCRLLRKVGPFGSVVVSEGGEVVHAREYAVACRVMRLDPLAYCVPRDEEDDLRRRLGSSYGEYHYQFLGVPAYNQGRIQPSRGDSSTWARVRESLLPEETVLDFGSGVGKDVAAARREGVRAWAYEPFLAVTEGGTLLNPRASARQILSIEQKLRRSGLFDVVVLSAVINAATSAEYEKAIVVTASLLTAESGRVILGTRDLYGAIANENSAVSRGDNRRVSLVAPDLFRATYERRKFGHGGQSVAGWTMVKFNTRETLSSLLSESFEEFEIETCHGSMMWAECRRPIRPSRDVAEWALEMEFNPEYPGGYRHGKHRGLVSEVLQLTRPVECAIVGETMTGKPCSAG